MLPVRSADLDDVLATIATASGFAIDADGYRLLDRAGRPSSIVTSFAETGYSIADLRGCMAEAAEEFDDTAELIMALLSPAADGGVGDDVAAEAAAAGFDIADYSPTVDPALTADEDLVQRYRRRAWLERKLTPLRVAARPRQSQRRDEGRAEEHARVSAVRASEDLKAALRQLTDDDWAEVWPVLLGSQTALAVDFIDRQVPRVYGQPPISFEDWAHLRWARGEHGRERLAESYLEQLRPKSGRSVAVDYRSWADRKWIEARAKGSISIGRNAIDQEAWTARSVADRAAKRRSDARRHALELGFTRSAETREPDDGLQLS